MPPPLSRLLPTLPRVPPLPFTSIRTFAVPAPSVYASPPPPPRKLQPVDPEGRLRPHLDVPVKPDHGLYKFFHVDKETGKPITLEAIDPNARQSESGRAWEAAELRRKSFKDLHIIWYLVLRERNVLATQKEEWRRERMQWENETEIAFLEEKLRQTAKRIKYVLNERRRAFKEARLITRRANRDRKNWEGRMARRRAEAEGREEESAELEESQQEFEGVERV